MFIVYDIREIVIYIYIYIYMYMNMCMYIYIIYILTCKLMLNVLAFLAYSATFLLRICRGYKNAQPKTFLRLWDPGWRLAVIQSFNFINHTLTQNRSLFCCQCNLILWPLDKFVSWICCSFAFLGSKLACLMPQLIWMKNVD